MRHITSRENVISGITVCQTMTGFEIMDHTADVGIRATGTTLEEVFANAARGMFHVISTVQRNADRTIRFQLDSHDVESLLYNFLSELLYRSEAENLLFTDFDLTIQDNRLRCEAMGFSRTPCDIDTEIKAVTYHGLKVQRDGEIWIVQVLFDI